MRRVTGWILVVLLVLAMAAVAQAEEVTVVEYPDSNYEPGPGWPEGWSPPVVPAELPESTRQYLESLVEEYEFAGLEVRVLEPLPAWTDEYPYRWDIQQVECGDMLYAYWYPVPDTQLISATWERTFSIVRLSSGLCRFEPVQFITEARKLSPEEQEAEARAMEFDYRVDKSHPGLGHNHGLTDEGSPENIYVYLNDGSAYRHFDVPAYLDTSVSRVRVPIRFISEFMGATVDWNEAAQAVTIHFSALSQEVVKAVPAEGYTYETIFKAEGYYPDPMRFRLEKQLVTLPERRIVLTIGKPKAVVEGQEVELDAPPVIKGNRTMVPIRFVAEQMGAKVYWVGDQPIFRRTDGSLTGTYQVHIYTPLFPLYEYPSWYMENRARQF